MGPRFLYARSASMLWVVAAVALVALAPASWANHGVTNHASTGPADTNGANDVFFERISEDGSRVFFTTREQLVSEDQDGVTDIYEYSAGGVRVVSTGPTDSGTTGPIAVDLEAASSDGTRVFFTTVQSLVPGDTDSNSDLYERHGNVTTLVSTGDVGGNGDYSVCSSCRIVTTPDGSHVFFYTRERLVAADIDSDKGDVYERAGGVTRLVSTGPNDGPVQDDVFSSVSASDDGERVAFFSPMAHVPDGGGGIFVRSNGTTTTWVPTDGLDLDASFDLSRDGSRVWFGGYDFASFGCVDEFDTETACHDLYEYSGGTVTNLHGGGNAFFAGATPDGTNVFLHVDCGIQYPQSCPFNLVRYRAGTHSFIAADATFLGASDDGDRVFFETYQQLAAADTDPSLDVYERSGGSYTLISTGPASAGTSDPADGLRASSDGGRVVFTTAERLVSEDSDSNRDIYTRAGSTTTLLSHGPAGGNGAYDVSAGPGDVSKDAARVVFRTAERLAFSDEDNSLDAYVAGPADTTGHPRPAGATPFRVSLVPAFKPCTTPNREHGPPLVFPSCNPPDPGSPNLTVGVGDGNPALSRSVGHLRLGVLPGAPGGADDSDVRIRFSLSNVMRTSDLSEYTGELRSRIQVRLTDRLGGVPQTTQHFPLAFDIPCVPTADTLDKSLCGLVTSIDSLVPGAAAEGTRAIWALDQVRVYDGGPDENGTTTADNSLFAVQGVFVP